MAISAYVFYLSIVRREVLETKEYRWAQPKELFEYERRIGKGSLFSSVFPPESIASAKYELDNLLKKLKHQGKTIDDAYIKITYKYAYQHRNESENEFVKGLEKRGDYDE